MRILKVLVGCEESQEVCKAFRKLGHEAYSCDIIPCSGGKPEWHLQMDVFEAIKLKKWDLMIAHPPCTYLANSGVQHLHKHPERWSDLKKARDFFIQLYDADIPMKCIENPVPHKYAELPKYTQIIQPYQHGHECMKRTCLWLKNLPELKPTKIVGEGEKYIGKDGKSNGSKWYQLLTLKDRQKLRSKTFPGIARAMAEQWSEYLINSFYE